MAFQRRRLPILDQPDDRGGESGSLPPGDTVIVELVHTGGDRTLAAAHRASE
jgi:hypothetical protein